MKKIIIIGGGVAGLGAAYELARARAAGADISYTLLEKDDRLGGQLWTDRVVDDNGNMIVADGGSDSYLTRKAAMKRTASHLGCADEIVSTRDENKKTFIVRKGKLVEMPDGIMMFAPTKILPLATTSLYSWGSKFRMLADVFIPRKKQPTAGPEDESLESLVVRRLGRGCLDNLAEAIVGGVNGSDPATMSIKATYPDLLAMEQEHGSLIRGFLAQRRKIEALKKAHPTPPGTKASTFFSSFRKGMGSFADYLADGAGRENLRTNAEVAAIAWTDGSETAPRYTVTLAHGEELAADALIIATPAWACANLLAPLSAEGAQIMASIPNSSCATVILAFDAADAPFDRAWHGILTPAAEHRELTGINLISSKWPDRCPDDKVLIRGFVGGPRDASIVERSDDELIDLARSTYEELLGLKKNASIRYAKVFRFPRSMPQYTVGHLDRMARLDTCMAQVPRVHLAGAAYRGVGVPNCLESGEQAADAVLADLDEPRPDGAGEATHR